MNDTQTQILLPNDVISPTDIYRLIRELEVLDNFFRQSEIRSGGTPQSPPRYSRLLDSVVTRNEINLLDQSARDSLLESMRTLSETAPVIHMSFSVDPPGAYIQKIVAWLRENLQQDILLRTGLQPNIGAGCVVRTTNHAYDFSLRKYFDSKREYFGQKLHDAVAAQDKHFDDQLDPQILSQTPVDQVDVANAKAPEQAKQDEPTQETPQAVQQTQEAPAESAENAQQVESSSEKPPQTSQTVEVKTEGEQS